MKTFFKYILIIILSTITINLFAQDDILDITKKLDPIEPSASGIAQYGVYPVNYSTGLPDISIPLYTIKSGDIEVPIELKYHGGGIQVNQEASWVGLGWDLFYGGEITRQVNGFPDEEENITNVPDAATVFQYMDNHPTEYYSTYLNGLADDLSNSFMPDIYYFNTVGYNGSFVLNNSGKPLLIPFSDYKVMFTGNSSTANPNKIIAPNGQTFEFALTDQTEVLPLSNAFPSYYSTWHINKIISNDGSDIINYTYQSDGVIQNITAGYYAGISVFYKICGSVINDQGVLYTISPISLSSSPSYQRITSKKPMTITFKGGRITFILGSRNDIYCGSSGSYTPLQKLEKIIIEREDTNGYSEIKRYEFVYSYFQACSSGTNCLKLRLDKIKEIASGKSQVLAEFNYYESTTYPEKNSFSTDFWGYYNGENNIDPIPYTLLMAYNSYEKIGNAIRNTSEEHTKIESLKSITHISKGKTEFDWEQNRYNTTNPIVNFVDMKTVTLSNSLSDGHTHKIPLLPIVYPPQGEYTSQFSIGIEQYVKVNYKMYLDDDMNQNHIDYDRGKITITNTTTNNIIASYSIQSDDQVHSEYILLPVGNYQAYIGTTCSNVYAEISFDYNSFNPTTNENNHPIGGLRIKSITNYDSDNTFASKKIFTYINPNTTKSSGVLTNDQSKSFENTTSTVQSEIISSTGGNTTCINNVTTTMLVHSDAVYGIHSNNVIYEYVQEYQQDSSGNDIGYVEYQFDVSEDYFTGNNLPLISEQWNRGQLMRETIYENNTSSYNKVKETIKSYSVDPRYIQSSTGFKMTKYINIGQSGYCEACSDYSIEEIYGPANYTYYSKWKYLTNTTTTEYFTSANFVTSTDFTYENPAYSWSNKQTVTESNGDVISTITKYPLDYTLDDDITGQSDHPTAKAISKMVKNNMINIPIESYTTLNHLKVSKGTFNNFKDYGNFVKPSEIYQVKTKSLIDIGNELDATTSDDNTRFNPSNLWEYNSIYKFDFDNNYTNDDDLSLEYDDVGNISQYQTANNIPVSFYYGYSDEFPIIKASNVKFDEANTITDLKGAVDNYLTTNSYSDIDDFLEDVGSLATTSQKALWADFVSSVQTALPDAQITTYTYITLVGIRSKTDVNGIITYYEYDDFGRLKLVRDKDENILQYIQYNYKQ